MLECHQIPDTNVLEFTLDGAFTREDFDRVKAKLEQMIAEHGQVRILEVIQRIGSMQPSAIWADLKFGPKHLKHFSHAAVVADQKWIRWATAPFVGFMRTEVRFFNLDQLDQARRWIREQPDPPADAS